MPSYRAIFLDAGYTILSPHSSWEQQLLQVTGRHGIDLSLQYARRAYEASQSFFKAHYYQPNETWTDDAAILSFCTAYYRLGLEALQCPAAQVPACAEALASNINDPKHWRPYPEVQGVLAGLKKASYTVGVLSDWSSSLPAILEALGLRAYVDLVIVSAIEGVAKPQPAFFQRALARARVRADQALMVGDNLYADIQGAARAGIHGILINRDGWPSPPDVPTIRRLDELWAHLDHRRPIGRPE